MAWLFSEEMAFKLVFQQAFTRKRGHSNQLSPRSLSGFPVIVSGGGGPLAGFPTGFPQDARVLFGRQRRDRFLYRAPLMELNRTDIQGHR
jgi:hypothetical protein